MPMPYIIARSTLQAMKKANLSACLVVCVILQFCYLLRVVLFTKDQSRLPFGRTIQLADASWARNWLFSHRLQMGDHVNKGSQVSVMIAKTLSPSEVDETVLDIIALHDKPRTIIHWKLFCWARITCDLLQDKLDGRLTELNVELILKEKVLKTYYWYNHLREEDISSSTDYLWLLDGDLVVRHMAWDCYWDILERFQPMIAQPAIIDKPNRESHNYWFAVSHPSKCVNDPEFGKAIGLETSFIEQQAPIFRREAWIAFRKVLETRIGMWNHSHTTWGLDNLWCGVAQHDLLGYTYEKLLELEPPIPYRGNDICRIKRLERNKNRRVGCMIIHATPVLHTDTNTYDDENIERHTMGLERKQMFQQVFPEYYRHPCGRNELNMHCFHSRVGFHRSMWMDGPCQECRQYNCSL